MSDGRPLFPTGRVVMREDMGKVLVERPRVGSSKRRFRAKGYRRTLARDLAADRERPRERITALRGDTTHFNEHLAPLRRLLDARVGRRWDAVYAELCEHVDRGNVVQKHILTHLFQYVETDARLIDGVPCYPPHRRWGRYAGGEIRGRDQWYVCPKTGLLRRAKALTKAEERARRSPAAPPPAQVWVGKSELCRQRADGGWDLLTMRRFPTDPSWPQLRRSDPFDVSVGTRLTGAEAGKRYGKLVYAVDVRPLHKDELKHYPIPLDLLQPPRNAPNVVR